MVGNSGVRTRLELAYFLAVCQGRGGKGREGREEGRTPSNTCMHVHVILLLIS